MDMQVARNPLKIQNKTKQKTRTQKATNERGEEKRRQAFLIYNNRNS
jgi:hypothetical protein